MLPDADLMISYVSVKREKLFDSFFENRWSPGDFVTMDTSSVATAVGACDEVRLFLEQEQKLRRFTNDIFNLL